MINHFEKNISVDLRKQKIQASPTGYQKQASVNLYKNNLWKCSYTIKWIYYYQLPFLTVFPNSTTLL